MNEGLRDSTWSLGSVMHLTKNPQTTLHFPDVNHHVIITMLAIKKQLNQRELMRSKNEIKQESRLFIKNSNCVPEETVENSLIVERPLNV